MILQKDISLVRFIAITLLFWVPVVNADFAVVDEEYYGNSETLRFNRAIHGGDPLSCQEAAELAAELPVREVDHWYARFDVTQARLSLQNVKNKSTGVFSNFAIATSSQSIRTTGLDFAIGYVMSKNFRVDLEYFANKTLTYTANPVFAGSGQNFSANIRNNTFLLNGFYDFTDFSRFVPYLGAGLGFSINNVSSRLNPGGTQGTNSLNFAAGVAIGMRVGFLTNWYANLAYRYVILASTLNINGPAGFKLTGNYVFNGFSLGLMFLF